jgi:iron complex transport system ATP-binding protein
MYEARSVTVRIGGKTIVDGIDLTVAAGKVVALIGPNGAGKSTLLKTFAGERKPTSGSIELHGRELSSYRPAALAMFRSVLAQSVTLAFPFTVSEVVRLGLPARVTRAKADALERSALAAVGMEAFAERPASELSGGEQQRVHLARVLVQLWANGGDGLARYLLLDEPTASLDLAHQVLVLKIARAHADAGGGALAVLHDLNLAAMVADEVVALDRGRVVARGTPAEVISDRLMAETYGIGIKVSQIPESVFALPQTAPIS